MVESIEGIVPCTENDMAKMTRVVDESDLIYLLVCSNGPFRLTDNSVNMKDFLILVFLFWLPSRALGM